MTPATYQNYLNTQQNTDNISVIAARSTVDRIVSSTSITTSYSNQVSKWSEGLGQDPAALVNSMPALNSEDLIGVSNSALMIQTNGTDKVLSTGIADLPISSVTGEHVNALKMSEPASALIEGADSGLTINKVVSYESDYIPINVSLNVQNPSIINNVRVRIQLKSRNALADQVVASGSKIFNLERKFNACLLPINAPDIKVLSLGSQQIQIQANQNDVAGTHVAIFAKFFDKNGNSKSRGWKKFTTFRCADSATFIHEFKEQAYDTIAIRAISLNRMGYGSRFTSASVKNVRSNIMSKSDSIIGIVDEMPVVITVNSSIGAIVLVRNLNFCKYIRIVRENLSTGELNIAHSRVLFSERDVITFTDKSVKPLTVYRYFVQYCTDKKNRTLFTSYKDALYKRLIITRFAQQISLKPRTFTTSVGSNLSTIDDNVKIMMSIKFTKKGLKSIQEALRDAGAEHLVESDVASILSNVEKILAIKVARTDVVTGERIEFDFKRIGSSIENIVFTDDENTRRSTGAMPPSPGKKYSYKIRLYRVSIADMLGSDSGTRHELQNPGTTSSILMNPSKRFFINSDSLNAILPSDLYVNNLETNEEANVAYERNYIGIEKEMIVSIPSMNNFIQNIKIDRITNQISTLSWDYGGDPNKVDHFVILESGDGRIIPIGTRMSVLSQNKYQFHIRNTGNQIDRTYIVRAYDDSGQMFASDESELFIPNSPVPLEVISRSATESQAIQIS
jgi:hypothetical protein